MNGQWKRQVEMTDHGTDSRVKPAYLTGTGTRIVGRQPPRWTDDLVGMYINVLITLYIRSQGLVGYYININVAHLFTNWSS